jgi:hypothetical protein
MPKPFARKHNSTHRAVWTIALGAVLACVMPWVLTHFYTGITFPATSHISDNIGGIAGPILNFVGLLVVYFSLREQFNANQIQLRNFKKEQRRNSNENTISTAFKIIDDLRTEAWRLASDENLKGLHTTEHLSYINYHRYPDFGEVNYRRTPRLLDYKLDLDEATAPKQYPYTLERDITEYFQVLDEETKVLRATFSMLLYLLDRSQLPLSQRLHFYTIIQAVYEPLVIKLLDGLEVFRPEDSAVDELVNNVWYLQEQLNNGQEALVDLEIHEPGQQH